MSVERKITPVQAIMSFEQRRDSIIRIEEAQKGRKEKFYNGVAICSEAVKHAGSFGMYFILAYYPLTRGTDFGEWTRAIAAVAFATLATEGTETVQNKLDTMRWNRRSRAIRETRIEMEKKLDPELNDLTWYIADMELIDDKGIK